MKDLAKRVVVALWGIPLLLGISYLGGYFFLVFILVIHIVSLWEFYSMYGQKGIYPFRLPGVILGTLLILFAFYRSPEWFLVACFLTIIAILLLQLRKQPGTSSSNGAYTLIGIFYISLFLCSLLLLRTQFEQWVTVSVAAVPYAGGRFLIALWGAIWICDTAAYFGGKALGRHKLAPSISPNKTREGAFLGFLGGVLSFLLLGRLLLAELPWPYYLISGLIVGILGQLGDLVESRFKRDAGVKDTSALIPGHGGFLDRFDSLIFVSPFLFFLFYFGQSG